MATPFLALRPPTNLESRMLTTNQSYVLLCGAGMNAQVRISKSRGPQTRSRRKSEDLGASSNSLDWERQVASSCLSVCLATSLSVEVSIYMYMQIFVYLCLHLSVSTYVPINVLVYVPIYVPIHQFINHSVSQSINRPFCLDIFPPIQHLPTYSPTYLVYQPINPTTNQPVNQSTNQPVNQSTNQPN